MKKIFTSATCKYVFAKVDVSMYMLHVRHTVIYTYSIHVDFLVCLSSKPVQLSIYMYMYIQLVFSVVLAKIKGE